MTAVTYIARRSLISGHVVDTSYSLDLSVMALDRSREVDRQVVEPLSKRSPEIIRNGARRSWSVSLARLQGETTPYLSVIEFLDSCDAQTFTFDPYGSAATPDAPISARLEDDTYSLRRVTTLGQGGKNDFFEISFRVVEV